MKPNKPLGKKLYGSTPHLIGSRVGTGDHTLPEKQSLFYTEGPIEKKDRIVITEKVDGSCVGATKQSGVLLSLQRAGYPCETSPYALHHHFKKWVDDREKRFRELLTDGESVVGEWMQTAMGTLYQVTDPEALFLGFAIFRDGERVSYDELTARLDRLDFRRPALLSDGPPRSIEWVDEKLGYAGFHGAKEEAEGAIWVHEKDGKFNGIAKYVRESKISGKYFIGEYEGKIVENFAGELI